MMPWSRPRWMLRLTKSRCSSISSSLMTRLKAGSQAWAGSTICPLVVFSTKFRSSLKAEELKKPSARLKSVTLLKLLSTAATCCATMLCPNLMKQKFS